MIEFNINTDTYFLPSNWNEVNYDQYQKITALQEDESLTGTDKAVQIVAILTGVPLATLEAAGFGIIIPLFNHLSWLKTSPEQDPTEHVTVLGVNYYAQTIKTVAELALFDKVSQAETMNDREKLPYILAILLRKRLESTVKQGIASHFKGIFKRQSVENDVEVTFEDAQNDFGWLQKRAKLFAAHLTPAQIMGLSAFFLQNAELSQIITQRYSEAAAILPIVKELSAVISEKNTDGWLPSSIWNRIRLTILRGYVWTLERSLTNSNIIVK